MSKLALLPTTQHLDIYPLGELRKHFYYSILV